ncbi:MAG: YjbH domain-containing protein [Armatimonadetes bacterium]|nr:YjbH domain-containing protein [Armatimonadota bacterium]
MKIRFVDQWFQVATCAALMALLSSNSQANPLLLAPTGNTLTTGQFRLEMALSPGNSNGKYYWLATGFKQFEANLIGAQNVDGKTESVLGAQWCFLPETFITPAVSFGATDIGSQTERGIAGYFAVTKHVSTEGVIPFLKEFSATLGLGVGGIRGPFASFEAKFPAKFFLQGEYDSLNANGALGWQPTSFLRFKAYSIKHDTYFGVELTPSLF